MPPPSADPPATRRLLLVALVVGLSVVGSALADPRVWLAGEATVDAYGSWWFQWWVARAITLGQSPFFAPVIFHPWGKDILTHTGGNVLDAAALVPVRALLGPGVAWNLLVFVAAAGNAAAAGLWARRMGAAPLVVAAGQVLVGLHPFVLNELRAGRPTQAILAPLFLALMYGEAGLRGEGRRPLFASAALLALAGAIYWYAAAFGALALCLLAFGPSPGRPPGPSGFAPRVGRLATIGFGALLLSAPLVVPLAIALARGEIPGLLPLDQWWAGVRDYENAQGGPVWIATLDSLGRAVLTGPTGRSVEGLALGVMTALPILAAPRRWWPAIALAGVLVAGPFPADHLNIPYLTVVTALPPFHRLYWPVRATVLLAAAALVGLVTLAARLPARAQAAVAIGVILGVVGEPLVRGGFPLDRWRVEVPAVVQCLGRDPGAGLILPYGVDQLPLVWQTVIEAPMLNGMAEASVSLVPPEQQAFRKNNGWVNALITAAKDPAAGVPWSEDEKAAVQALGYRWVVLRAEPLLLVGSRVSPRTQVRAVQRKLTEILGPPVHTDDDVTIWAPWGGLEGCR